MKAILVNEFGPAENLIYQDTTLPDLKSGEVQIKISFAGVNFMDIGTRVGQTKRLQQPPLIPGVEGSGVITKPGPDTKTFKVGDRVAWVYGPGSYAEYINIHENSLVKIPDKIDDQTAAAVMMQGITASHFGTQFYDTKPGDVALINAAAGGVGLILTQIIKNRGGIVIGRVSSQDKVQAAVDAGADKVIVANSDFAEEVLKITEGRGVDVVYDGSGPATFEASANSLKPGGIFCWYGPVLGGQGSINLMSLPNDIKVGYAVFFHHVPTPERLRSVTYQLFDWIQQGKLKIKIHKVYALSDAASAHKDMESRKTEGKLLLRP